MRLLRADSSTPIHCPNLRGTADVNRDIEDADGDDTDQLPLRLLDLIVTHTQDTPQRRSTVIILDEDRVAVLHEAARVPALEKETAVVARQGRLDQQEIE